MFFPKKKRVFAVFRENDPYCIIYGNWQQCVKLQA